MKYTVPIILMVALGIGGCSVFKKIMRKADDVAVIACKLFAEENPEVRGKTGLTPKQWCSIAENVQVYWDEIWAYSESKMAEKHGIPEADRSPK